VSDKHVELAQITLPSFGLPTSEPTIPPHTYEGRLAEARRRAAASGYDALLVYADREHFANLAYLTGFDPRFEEALLIVVPERSPTLLAGNEDVVYTAISPLILNVVLYQTFSLLSQPRATSAPLTTILRDAGLGDGGARRVGIAGWKYFGPEETDDADRWSEAPAYLVDTLRGLGCDVRNANRLFMDPQQGMRAINDVDQLASFEFAATHSSQSLRNLLFAVRPGMSEFEAFALMVYWARGCCTRGTPSAASTTIAGRGAGLWDPVFIVVQHASAHYRLLSKGAAKSAMNASVSALWSRRRYARLPALPRFGRPRLPVGGDGGFACTPSSTTAS